MAPLTCQFVFCKYISDVERLSGSVLKHFYNPGCNSLSYQQLQDMKMELHQLKTKEHLFIGPFDHGLLRVMAFIQEMTLSFL